MSDDELKAWAERMAPAGLVQAAAVLRLLADRDRLRALAAEWWRAAAKVHNAKDDAEEAAGWADLDALRTGNSWAETPEPVAQLLCDQRDRALAENARLRAALEPFAGALCGPPESWDDVEGVSFSGPELRRAAEALAGVGAAPPPVDPLKVDWPGRWNDPPAEGGGA